MDIQENVKLSDYTTFRIGGNARYFKVIKNEDGLKEAVAFAERKSLPLYILGGGSNLLISDDGVNGLVIKMEIKEITWTSDVQVIAGAGEIWDDLVRQCVEKDLYGIENLSYIPGIVGASVIQNIGAYGTEVKDVVDWVEVFDTKTKEIKKLNNLECKFGYRDSIFKKPEGKNFVVLRVAYNLEKDGEININYKDIKNWIDENHERRSFLEEERSDGRGAISGSDFQNKLKVKDVRNIVIDIRKKKLPDWNKVGTAGSFFKNPIITKEQLEKILEKYPELPHYNCGLSDSPQFKIPLAYLLDKLGWKEKKEGYIGLHNNQPLALVNSGEGTSEDIKKFSQKIKEDIKQKTGIEIELEVVVW